MSSFSSPEDTLLVGLVESVVDELKAQDIKLHVKTSEQIEVDDTLKTLSLLNDLLSDVSVENDCEFIEKLRNECSRRTTLLSRHPTFQDRSGRFKKMLMERFIRQINNYNATKAPSSAQTVMINNEPNQQGDGDKKIAVAKPLLITLIVAFALVFLLVTGVVVYLLLNPAILKIVTGGGQP